MFIFYPSFNLFLLFNYFRHGILANGFLTNTYATGLVVFTISLLSTPALADKEIPPVVPAKAKFEAAVEEIPLSGSAFPWRESALSPQVDGLVLEIFIDDGDEVKKGELLIRLDSTIADLNSLQAKAALGEAKASYRESVRQRDEASKLVEDRHVAATAYKALVAETNMKQAVVARLKAEYERAAEISRRYKIVAPFDGIVGNVLVEIGQWVESGEVAINLFDIETLKIRVQVPQRRFSSIGVDTPAILRFDALPGTDIEASVSRKIPIGNPSARTFPVRIDLANRNHKIAPGMSAQILFQINRSEKAPVLTVPRDALMIAPDGSKSIWKTIPGKSNHTVISVPITTGRFFRDSVEVTGGSIKAGDQVVVRGNEILKSGQKVRLLKK